MLKFLFSTKGRLKRLPYVAFVLPSVTLIEGGGFVARSAANNATLDTFAFYFAIPALLQLLLMWPLFALSVKRLHDLNWKAYPAILVWFPLVFMIAFTVLPFFVPMIDPVTNRVSSAFSTTNQYMSRIGQVLYYAKLILMVTLCLIPGTKGPSRYDPSRTDDGIFE